MSQHVDAQEHRHDLEGCHVKHDGSYQTEGDENCGRPAQTNHRHKCVIHMLGRSKDQRNSNFEQSQWSKMVRFNQYQLNADATQEYSLYIGNVLTVTEV